VHDLFFVVLLVPKFFDKFFDISIINALKATINASVNALIAYNLAVFHNIQSPNNDYLSSYIFAALHSGSQL